MCFIFVANEQRLIYEDECTAFGKIVRIVALWQKIDSFKVKGSTKNGRSVLSVWLYVCEVLP